MTNTVITNPNKSSSKAHVEPGYVSTVSVKGKRYKIFVYLEASDGSKTYLPSDFDPQTLKKVKALTEGLLNAHASQHPALDGASLEIQGLDATGLIQTDNTTLSHDFLVQPVNAEVAKKMTHLLAQSNKTVEASALSAKEVWNAMEELIHSGIKASPSVPADQLAHSSPTISAIKTPEPIRYKPTDIQIPLISYIDLAYKEQLSAPSLDDLQIWESLPRNVRIDALRHVSYFGNCKGKAEEIACRLFKLIPKVQEELNTLVRDRPAVERKEGLSAEFLTEGEKLLELYYSPQTLKNFSSFMNTFSEKLPKETLFFRYFYEIALEAGVHVESWDHQFAEHNWTKVGMIALSIQALERALHT
jgi:hypothetical protein